MINRNEILAKLHQTLDQKTQYFQNLIEDLRSSNTDTKSSMGDKYETSREMLQQGIMQLQRQLDNVLMQKSILNRVKEPVHEKISFGSIVKTSMGNFVIAISLPEFDVSGEKYIGISEQTPLARQLIGKSKTDTFTIQQKEREILEIG